MQRIAQALLLFLSGTMILYHLVASQYLIFSQWEHQTIHLCFLLLLSFLGVLLKTQKISMKLFMIICMVLSVVMCAYVFMNIEELEMSFGFPEPIAVKIGIVLIVLIFISTYLNWGLALPIVAGIFMTYFFFGHMLSGALFHAQFSPDYIISYLCIGLSGVYGMFLSISANQIFLFVVFGALLSVFKVNALFMELGKIAGTLLRGGPGLTAVVSSSLIGMVSGAPVANVAITGAFTIPYMKKIGYTAEEAGAIEAVASTGGQIMPPVMGAAAFLMATFIGKSYSVVMLAAIIPAIIFYFAVTLGVQFMATAKNMEVVKETIDWPRIWRGLPVFVIPIGITFVLLMMRFSPMNVAFWAISATLIVGFAQKETRPTWRELIHSACDGAVVGAKIGISLALVGIMAQTLITTGLGSKIASLVQMLSGGSLLVALILTMFVAIILGCSVPPAAAYALCAVVVVPTIVPLGADLLSAHFFTFYFAIISAITPPVGLASLAASGLAGGNFLQTGLKGFRLAFAGFVLPYMIIYNPIFTWDTSNFLWFGSSFAVIIIAITTLSALMYNTFITRMAGLDRLLAALVTIIGFTYIFVGGSVGTIQSLGWVATLLTLFSLFIFRQKRNAKAFF
jgi:TRAP transporter 4TM/12TM fusion protein